MKKVLLILLTLLLLSGVGFAQESFKSISWEELQRTGKITVPAPTLEEIKQAFRNDGVYVPTEQEILDSEQLGKELERVALLATITPAYTVTSASLQDTLHPDGDTIYNPWTPSTGTTHYNLVNDSSDTTYMSTGSTGTHEFHTFTNTSNCSGKAIDKITYHYRAKHSAGGANTPIFARYQAADYDTIYPPDAGSTPNLTTSFVEYTVEDTSINGKTGVAWTSGNIDSYRFAYCSNMAAGTYTVSEFWLVIDCH